MRAKKILGGKVRKYLWGNIPYGTYIIKQCSKDGNDKRKTILSTKYWNEGTGRW